MFITAATVNITISMLFKITTVTIAGTEPLQEFMEEATSKPCARARFKV